MSLFQDADTPLEFEDMFSPFDLDADSAFERVESEFKTLPRDPAQAARELREAERVEAEVAERERETDLQFERELAEGKREAAERRLRQAQQPRQPLQPLPVVFEDGDDIVEPGPGNGVRVFDQLVPQGRKTFRISGKSAPDQFLEIFERADDAVVADLLRYFNLAPATANPNRYHNLDVLHAIFKHGLDIKETMHTSFINGRRTGKYLSCWGPKEHRCGSKKFWDTWVPSMRLGENELTPIAENKMAGLPLNPNFNPNEPVSVDNQSRVGQYVLSDASEANFEKSRKSNETRVEWRTRRELEALRLEHRNRTNAPKALSRARAKILRRKINGTAQVLSRVQQKNLDIDMEAMLNPITNPTPSYPRGALRYDDGDVIRIKNAQAEIDDIKVTDARNKVDVKKTAKRKQLRINVLRNQISNEEKAVFADLKSAEKNRSRRRLRGDKAAEQQRVTYLDWKHAGEGGEGGNDGNGGGGGLAFDDFVVAGGGDGGGGGGLDFDDFLGGGNVVVQNPQPPMPLAAQAAEQAARRAANQMFGVDESHAYRGL